MASSPFVTSINVDPRSISVRDFEATPLLDHSKRGDSEEEKGASVLSSIFNLTNSIVGAGLLAFPYAIRCTGVVSGIIVVALFVALAGITLRVVFSACVIVEEETNGPVNSYQQIVEHFLGGFARKLVEICMLIYCMGACVIYMDIIGDSFEPVMHTLLGSSPVYFLSDRRLIIIITSCLVIFPLGLLRSVDSLKFTSVLSICAAAYLVSMIVAFWIKNAVHGAAFTAVGVPERLFMSFDVVIFFPRFFLVLPLIAFAFDCHLVAPPIFAELQKPRSQWKLDAIVISSLGLVLVGYLTAGVLGFLLFGSDVMGDILRSFEGLQAANAVEAVAGFCARAAMGIVAVCSFPIVAFVERLTLATLFCRCEKGEQLGSRRLGTSTHVFLSTFLFVMPLLLAILIPGITWVIGFIGGIFASLLMFFFPALLLWKMLLRTPKEERAVKWMLKMYVGVPFFLLFAVGMFFIGPVTNLLNIIDGLRKSK